MRKRQPTEDMPVPEHKDPRPRKKAGDGVPPAAPPRASSDRFRTLFETAQDAIIHAEAETGVIIDVNPAMLALSGCSRGELIGKPLWEIAPLRGSDAALVAFRELRQNAVIRYDDLPFRTKGEKTLSVEFVCSLHPTNHARIIQCTIRDMTTRKALAELLQKAESRFKALFNHAAVGIALVDPGGAVLDANPQLERMLGFGTAELRGRQIAELTLPADRTIEEALLRELLAGGRDSYQLTARCLRRDGSPLWGLINGSVVLGVDARPQFVVRTVTDISGQKSVEDALAESEERFRQIAESIREVFWIAVSDYSRVLYVSPAYEEIWGGPRAALYADALTWIEAIHPDDRDAVVQSLQQDEQFEAEYRIRRPDGTERWIHDRGFPLKDAAGGIYRIVGIAEDITERRRMEEALRESESQFRLLFENMTDGFALHEMLYDDQGRPTDYTYREVNPAFEKLTGLSAGSVIGKTVRQVLPEIEHYWLDAFDRVVRTGVPIAYENYSQSLNRYFSTRAFSPQPGLFAVIFTDVTERRRAEDDLRRFAGEINDLYNNAPCGYHSLDENGVIVRINDTELSWLGYNRAEVEGKMHLTDLVTAEGRKIFAETFPLFKKRGWFHDLEFEMVRKDGSILWVLANASLVRDSEGRFVMSRSTLYDITDRKKAQEALAQSESTLRSFYESASMMMGVVELTDDGTIVHISDNPATARFFHVAYLATANRPADDIGAPSEAIREWVRHYRESHDEGRPVRFEYLHPLPDGPRWLAASVAFIGLGPTGHERYSYVAEDVTERKRAEERLREANELLRVQATIDVLTGIFNRLQFADFLEHEMQESARYGHPLCLIMFDVDHFKRINDTYGHLVGDDVLRNLVTVVAARVRRTDIFARWGGEEFMILTPHSALESSRRVAETMRSSIAAQPLPGVPEGITCSFGVAQYARGDTMESFTNRVDIALYRAKRAGRNCVEIAPLAASEQD